MTVANEKLRAAQVRWELQLAILQEEERRLVTVLEEHSRGGAAVPQELLDRLKAARAQCNTAFQSLMNFIQERITRDADVEPARHR